MNDLLKFQHPALEDCPESNGKDYIMLKGCMIVCPSCHGTGRHVRRDIDDSRLVDSMIEDGDDEGLEAYYAGAYDTGCTTCNGANVIMAPDPDLFPEWASKAIQSYEECERECRRIGEAERRMGA